MGVHMFVYLIINTATQKYYVGQHKGTNLKKYLQQKLSHANSKKVGSSRLFNSMRKHPKDVWEILPLVSDIGTREAVDAWEQTLIELFDSRNPEVGYNICKGGEGFTGRHSPETKEIIANASKEAWQRPGYREAMVAKMTGQKRSPETCAAIGRGHEGIKASPETKQRLSISHMGHVRSPESRKKQSESTSGAKNWGYGKNLSDTHCAKLKEGHAKAQYYSNCPEHGRMLVKSSRSKCPACKQVSKLVTRRKKIIRNGPTSRKGVPFSVGHCASLSKAQTGKTRTDEHRKNIGLGSSKAWTPERRAAKAEQMRQRVLDDPTFFKENRDTPPNTRPIRCIDTGEVFPSVTQAVRSFGLVRGCNLTREIKKGKTFQGKKWEYVNE
jgi:hypothetical protein